MIITVTGISNVFSDSAVILKEKMLSKISTKLLKIYTQKVTCYKIEIYKYNTVYVLKQLSCKIKGLQSNQSADVM